MSTAITAVPTSGTRSTLARFDVGIVPLGLGPWEQAKSPYELLQYMAMALPVIATPVGAAREVIRHGENGGERPRRRATRFLTPAAILRAYGRCQKTFRNTTTPSSATW